jgi:hypothetical protein
MTEHLGYDKHNPAGHNCGTLRNGTRIRATDVAAELCVVLRVGGIGRP